MGFLTTILELSAVIFVIWGYFNEDKFIAFEQGVAKKIKQNIKKQNRRDKQC